MTIDLKELLLLLFRNVKWIILTVLAGGALAFVITWGLIPFKYTSSVSLYVNNNATSAQASALNINDINASQKLVNTYIVILKDDEVMKKVIDRLLLEYTQESLEGVLNFTDLPGGRALLPETLRKTIHLTSVNSTEVLRIDVETKSAELSARICTIMVEVAPEILQRVVKAGSVEVIGEAKPAEKKSSPNFTVNCIVGALIGAMVSVVTIVVLNTLDTTIKGAEDLKNRFNIPVLGEIPEFGAGRGGRYGNYNYGK